MVLEGAALRRRPPGGPGQRVRAGHPLRTVTAIREVGGWAVGFAVVGPDLRRLVALMRSGESLGANCWMGTMWGLFGGAVVGAMVWAGQQAARDAEILRAEQED